ncbi:hypothetical protein SAMN04488589_0618 [Methanolobus vulcani]|uniref:Uncharacterized protein n=1 Tax=Methanolobus vulcani TaxID=38026 RepID=A0A7Z7AUY6_9EURY|nr:hypothetical protein [Methanolobus vulcani]SDF46998.1 hypothetical protein SAMN04488589_0618 [Methanolobus vulcani]
MKYMKLVNDMQGMWDEDELEIKIDTLSNDVIKFIENEITILPQSPLKYNTEFKVLATINNYKKEIRNLERIIFNEFDNPDLHLKIQGLKYYRQKQIHKLWLEYKELLFDNYEELKERALQIKSTEIQNLYQQIISDEQKLTEMKSEEKELKKLKLQSPARNVINKQIRENHFKQIPIKQNIRLNMNLMSDIIREHELHSNFCEECYNIHCIEREYEIYDDVFDAGEVTA